MERIQKILARGGVASRRAAEELIVAGRVRVNGHVITELGTKADPRRDRVEVDGKRIVAEQPVYVALHKPRGVVSTMSDPEGRPTVREFVASIPARVYPVGRLDFATSGLLLATNDGAFADGLLHPRQAVPKMYVVKVKGVMKPEDLEVWRKGVRLEDGMTLPADVTLIRHEGDKTWMTLTIREGRNQQIRRMGEASGFPVMRLARVAFADVTLEGLAPGRWRYLTRDELVTLKKTYGVPKSIPSDTAPAEAATKGRQRAVPAPRRGAGARGQGHDAAGEGRRDEAGPRRGAGARGQGQGETATKGWGRGGGAHAEGPAGEKKSWGRDEGAPRRGGGARAEGPAGEKKSWGRDEGAPRRGPGKPDRGEGRERVAPSARRGEEPDAAAGGAEKKGWRRSAEAQRRGANRGQKHDAGERPTGAGRRGSDGQGKDAGGGVEKKGWGRSEGAPRRGAGRGQKPDAGEGRGRATPAGRRGSAGQGQGARGQEKPRHGGGSPGRRGPEVTEDGGGGARRGNSGGRSDRPDDRGPPQHGGRFGRTRTTGTAGGIGTKEPAPRVKGRRGR